MQSAALEAALHALLRLAQDQVGIVTDSKGHPTHSALAFPSTPSALAVSGIYVLAACADGLHAYDRATSAWVQSLPYPGGVRTAPGQQLSSAQNASGSCVLIAGFRKVCKSPFMPEAVVPEPC